jgi:hypothetical protein
MRRQPVQHWPLGPKPVPWPVSQRRLASQLQAFSLLPVFSLLRVWRQVSLLLVSLQVWPPMPVSRQALQLVSLRPSEQAWRPVLRQRFSPWLQWKLLPWRLLLPVWLRPSPRRV